MEIPVNDRRFTWSNMRRNPSMAKLDRVLVSLDWECKFPLATAKSCIRNTSDHVPILLSSGENGASRLKPRFRFEKMWLQAESFNALVCDSLGGPISSPIDPARKLVRKLGRLRTRLKRWNRNSFGNIFIKKEGILKQIEELERKEETMGLQDEEFVRLGNLRKDILQTYSMEETLWKQRSRVKWLMEGDSNTAFFHRTASMRRRNNLIHSLNVEGREVVQQTEIITVVDNEYKVLFGSSTGKLCEIDASVWGELSHESAQGIADLEKPFTEEEIKCAVWGLGADKAPGPDGFPILFYKKYWDMIKGNLVDMMEAFFLGNLQIERINYALVTLIPKRKEIRSTNDLRPISLINCSLKILSKVLANHLRSIIGTIIDDYQTGFIAGRDILDGIASVQEVIQDCKRRKKKGFMLKLDFEKAYDTVEWTCLLDVLQKRKFGKRWIGWIQSWLESAKVKVLVNGVEGKEILCRRGLRQGDPLSPLLFTLVADGLNRMLNHCQSHNLLTGLGEGGKVEENKIDSH